MLVRTPFVATLAVALLAGSGATAVAAAPAYTIPPRTSGVDVAALLDGRITLAKADAPVALPLQTLRVYAYETTTRRGSDAFFTSRSWIVRRTGAHPTYGSFTPVTVSSHAAGPPVVATVTQVQAVDPGSATYLPLGIRSRVGDDGSRGTTVRGSTLLRVVALQVGGAAVDVGTGCVTARTLDLTLTGAPDFSDLRGGLLSGRFTVPPFTGCLAGASTTLTRAFSGTGNSVTLARGAAGTWDTTAPRDCGACGRPPAFP